MNGIPDLKCDTPQFAADESAERSGQRDGACSDEGGSAGGLAVGSQLCGGRFVVQGILGRGGMGVIFEAFDQEVGEKVALKSLTWLADGALSALKHEFRVLADVVHPNLVGLRGLYQDGSHCFFSMDVVRGDPFPAQPPPAGAAAVDAGAAETLARRPQPRRGPATVPFGPGVAVDSPASEPAPTTTPARGSLTTEQVTRLRALLVQLLSGVAAIHEAGKVHRDLKPSNVLVTDEDRVVILDFGLAGELRRLDPTEWQDHVSGTPAYMAPEQAAGSPPRPENDCYAVGAMLYEALTGRLPFRGSPGQMMAEKQSADPPAPLLAAAFVPADLSEVCMRLLSRVPTQRYTAREALHALGHEAAPRQPSLLAPRVETFVGRSDLLSQMDEVLQKAVQQRRVTVLEVVGRSGLGKSALLQRFAERTAGREATLFLQGRCYEREGLPHKGIDQVLSELTRVLQRNAELRGVLSSLDTAALRTLMPELQPPDAEHSVSDSEPRALRKRAGSALRALLLALSQRRTVVIAIDDMQWADSDGVRLLLELMGGAWSPPLLWILSYRESAAEPQHGLREGVRRLLDSVAVEQLNLQPLTEAEATALAERLLIESGRQLDGDEVAALCREAKGSPLLLSELAQHHATLAGRSLPAGDALQGLLERRLSELSEDTRHLFNVVCVAGRPIEPRRLASASRLATPERELRALRQLRLLRSCRDRGVDAFDVFHDSIRERALTALRPQQRRDLHAELARAYALDPEGHAEQLVTHYEGAEQAEQAARFAAIAARGALAALAFDHAAGLFRKAFTLDPAMTAQKRTEMTLQLAEALSGAGRGAEAAPLFMDVATCLGHPDGLELRRRAAEQWLVSGRSDEGLRALDGVLKEVGLSLPKGPRRALAMLLFTRAQLRLRGLHFSRREEHQISRAELLRIDACRAAWALSFMNTIQGAAFQARYLQLALRAGEPRRVALGLGMEAIFRSTKGAAAEAEVWELRRAQKRIAASLEDPLVEAFVLIARGHSSYMVGKWRKCSDALAEAEEVLMARCRGVTWELNSSRFFWGNALALQGRVRELSQRMHDWLEDAHERSDHYASASLTLLSTRGVALTADDPQAAARGIELAMARWQASTFGVQQFLAEISRVQVHLYCDQGHEAVQVIERMWPAFTRSMMNQVQLCRIQAHQHAAAALLAKAAAEEERGPLLQRALAHAQRLEAEAAAWAKPFASYIRAAACHLTDDPEGAVRGLQLAVRRFRSLDMELYAAASERGLSHLLGGQAGKACIDNTDAVYRREGVRNPDRMANMMAPGLR